MTTPDGSAQAAQTHDAREGSGDPATDPAALGEEQFENPDGDGGGAPPQD